MSHVRQWGLVGSLAGHWSRGILWGQGCLMHWKVQFYTLCLQSKILTAQTRQNKSLERITETRANLTIDKYFPWPELPP